MKKIFLVLAFGFFTFFASAQDVHLSQYYTSDLSLNPAMTGHSLGDFKATLNYRNQWSQVGGPILTNFLSVEKKIHLLKDEIGIGLIVMDDRVSSVNYGINKFMLSGAYVKEIHGHRLSWGVQAGLVSYKSGLTSGTFPDQWNYSQGLFDPEDMVNGEAGIDGNSSYLDVNSGVYWSKKFGRVTPTVGYSAFHLTRPNQAVIANGVSLPFRSAFHSEASVKFGTLEFHPHVMYLATSKASNVLYGLNAIKSIGEHYRVLLGAESRYKDAAIAIFGIGIKEWDLGVSYDFNFSGLSETISQKTAFEISLTYTHPDKKYPTDFTVPCGIF